MIIRFYQGWFQMLYIDMPLFLASTFSISSFYLVSQKELFPKTWYRTFLFLPALMALGIGLTITNSKAVLEALVGHQSAFARTPKYRVVDKKDKSDRREEISQASGLDSLSRAAGRHLFRADSLVRHRQRELHHRSVPVPVRLRILVHGTDVAAARPLRQHAARPRRRAQPEALSSWCVVVGCRFSVVG